MNKEIKLASIFGARPQFIKASVLHRALLKAYPEIKHLLIHTGQHYDNEMSQIFFTQLNIPQPDYNLEVGSASHGEQTGLMLIRIEKTLLQESPSWVIVYGDTNSTLAGALAASNLSLKLAHVEAGLRSYNRRMPEEINRVLTDHISDMLFCPTEVAVRNLRHEGIEKDVFLVGDVMLDSLLFSIHKAQHSSDILSKFALIANTEGQMVKPYFLVTVHRAENTDSVDKLKSIISALNRLAEDEIQIIFPVHPRTQKMLSHHKRSKLHKGIELISPLPYLDILTLIKNASAVLTDSGGMQKEAYLLKTPCITLREETEWKETVESGWNCCAGTDYEAIIKAVNCFREKGVPSAHPSFYGDGKAGEKIVEILLKEANG